MSNASLKMPKALVTASLRDRALKDDQASVSEVIMALHVPSESNSLSLVLKIIFGDLSGDATTIKHKQSDLPQEEVVRRKRLRSQDSDQRPPSPQHTRAISPAGNVQEQILSDVEVDDAGPQVKSASGTSLSSDNQHLVEKDFTSHGSPESSTNFNL